MPQKFKFVSEDHGFVRTYYRGVDDRRLYCFQPVGRSGQVPQAYEFLTCSRDGEPCSPFAATPVQSRFDRLILPKW